MAAMVCVLAAFWPVDAAAKTYPQIAQQRIEQGRITEARRALQSELRIHPGNVDARYNLAVLLEEMDQSADAQRLYEQNLQRRWHLPSLVNLAALLEAHGNSVQARHWLETATQRMRHEAVPWYLLAAMSEKAGHIDSALVEHQHAIKRDPLNGFAWLRFADFQSRHGLADHGISYARKAMRRLQDCAICWRTYAHILQANGQVQQALAAYQRSLAIQPDAKTRQQLKHLLGTLKNAE